MSEFLRTAEEGCPEDSPRILDSPDLNDMELRFEDIKVVMKCFGSTYL